MIDELIWMAVDLPRPQPMECFRGSKTDNHGMTIGECALDLVGPPGVNKKPIRNPKIDCARTNFSRRSRANILVIGEPRTIPRFRRFVLAEQAGARSCQREPPVGGRFDSWPATARFCGRCHTDSTRERTQADAAAIRSS